MNRLNPFSFNPHRGVGIEAAWIIRLQVWPAKADRVASAMQTGWQCLLRRNCGFRNGQSGWTFPSDGAGQSDYSPTEVRVAPRPVNIRRPEGGAELFRCKVMEAVGAGADAWTTERCLFRTSECVDRLDLDGRFWLWRRQIHLTWSIQ